MIPGPHYRKLTAIFVFLLFFQTAFSQAEPTAFGAFTPAEIALEECSFDKEADAIVLFDQAQSTYSDNYELITQRRIRMKILKPNGIERGNIRIHFYSGEHFETVRNISGVVLNTSGQTQVRTELDRKSIFEKKLNDYYSEIVFALPELKVGSLFEYRYESVMQHYGGLREWVFQRDIPVLLSAYDLTIVPNAEFTYSVYKSPFMPISVKSNKRDGSIHFQMENIAGLRDEAFMSAPNDYLQRVKFQFSGYNRVKSNGYTTEVDSRTQYTNTWGKLARELWEDRGFGQAISRGASGAAAVQTAWNGAPDPYTKMKAIHAFVRSQFSWNHLYAIEAYEGLKNVWERRSGTNGEINLLLIALLKDAGLDVTPLLVSEHDHGKVDTTYPYRSQFNNVVAYVRLDNAHYILDGTDAQTPTYMIPFSLLNTTAFLVTKKDPSFITITDAGKKNLTLVNLSGTLSNEGAMQLQAQADLYDYAKADKRLAYRRDKKEYEKSFLYQFEPGMIDSFAVTGADADTLALHHDAALHYTLERTGDFALLRYNFFTGFTYNPFLPDQRFTDVDYGCAYTCILNAVFTLPDHLEPENLPKNVRLLLPDKTMSVTRQMQLTDNILRIGIRIEISKTAYSLETYPELQSFYKGLIDLLNEPVLLKPTK